MFGNDSTSSPLIGLKILLCTLLGLLTTASALAQVSKKGSSFKSGMVGYVPGALVVNFKQALNLPENSPGYTAARAVRAHGDIHRITPQT